MLRLAAELAPDHPGFLTQSALLELARDRSDDLIALVDRALAAGVVDLDLAVANLEYCNKTANRLAAEAKELRTTKYWVETRRVQNEWVKFPQYRLPTDEEKARADNLDAESKALRAKAPSRLQAFAERTRRNAEPRERAAHLLATAYLHFWKGDLENALAAAEAALAADPNSVRALRFAVGACRKGGMADKAARYQAALAELAGR